MRGEQSPITDAPTIACEIVHTEQGALAMRDRQTGEVMHPGRGPRAEAQALYIVPSRLRARLEESSDAPLVVYDVGLGAGSNAAAAFEVASAHAAMARPLSIVSFERTLEPLALALDPAHADAFGFTPESARAAARLLSEHQYASARVHWQLLLGDLAALLPARAAGSADIVFWDPYSPLTTPALWSVSVFRALRRACRAGATVHTYSAATATRTALLLAGFYVGLGPPSGRRNRPTTIAATQRELLEAPLGRDFLDGLARARLPFPADAPSDARAQIAAHAQFRDAT